jgi:hypothetical protein
MVGLAFFADFVAMVASSFADYRPFEEEKQAK